MAVHICNSIAVSAWKKVASQQQSTTRQSSSPLVAAFGALQLLKEHSSLETGKPLLNAREVVTCSSMFNPKQKFWLKTESSNDCVHLGEAYRESPFAFSHFVMLAFETKVSLKNSL